MPNWVFMTDFMLHHFLMFALGAAFLLYPIGRILSRMGFSPFWSIFAVIPLVNLVLLWVVAVIDWPRGERQVPN